MIAVDMGSPRRRVELTPVARSKRTFGAPVAVARPTTSYGESADASIGVPSAARTTASASSPVSHVKAPSRRASAGGGTFVRRSRSAAWAGPPASSSSSSAPIMMSRTRLNS